MRPTLANVESIFAVSYTHLDVYKRQPHIGAGRLIWLILDVGVRRPNQTWRWPEWLVCSQAELQKLTQLLSYNEQPVWQADEELERWFDRLAELVQESDPLESESRLKLAINGLLLAIMEMLEREHIPLCLLYTSRCV